MTFQAIKLDASAIEYTLSRKRNQPVFNEGDSIGAIYQVESGCVRLQKICTEGHRCILAFCYPGDFFGLGVQGPSETDAEAAMPSRLNQMSGLTLESLIRADPQKGMAIIDAAHGRADHSAEHQLVLACGHAEQKMAWFLGQIVEHTPSKDANTVLATLPMSRLDIADYLNVTIETVSRELGKLKKRGFIALENVRQIRILRPSALAALTHIDHAKRSAFVPNQHACIRARAA